MSIDSKELLPFFNWDYFFKTWSVNGKNEASENVRIELKKDAENLINSNKLSCEAIFGIFPINSENESVKVYDSAKKNLLAEFEFSRRQTPCANGLTPSLADFLAKEDYLGFFTLTSGKKVEEILQTCNDEYYALLVKITAETLVEAFAEKLHRDIAEKFWGYAKNSNAIGIRPAPGYPTCPDHKLKEVIFKLLEVEKNIGVTLTENFMMNPAASISAFVIGNNKSFYF